DGYRVPARLVVAGANDDRHRDCAGSGTCLPHPRQSRAQCHHARPPLWGHQGVAVSRAVAPRPAKPHMIPVMAPYQFLPMSAADLPLVRRWLHAPHVALWWGDAREQFALVRDDLDEPAMDQFIVVMDDRPFAYLQCYDPSAWPEGGLGPQPHG